MTVQLLLFFVAIRALAAPARAAAARALPEEHSVWERITNRFTDRYGGVEGFTSVVLEAPKEQTVPFTLLSMGGMSTAPNGMQQYLNDATVSQNDGYEWHELPKSVRRNAFQEDVPLPQFTKRWSSASTVLRIYNYNKTDAERERVYVVGGYYVRIGAQRNYNIFLNDIYYTDISISKKNATIGGLVWHLLNATDVCVEQGRSLSTCVFSPRYGHSLISFGGDFSRAGIDTQRTGINPGAQVSSYLILIGGRTSVSFVSDVWVSKDGGYTWKEQSKYSSFGGRAYHTTTAYFKKIFVFGGRAGSSAKMFNDVYRSEDVGKTWEQMTSAAPWEGRYRHMGMSVPLSKTLDSGILAVFGGYQSGTSTWFDDMWVSADDGATWCLNGKTMPFGKRSAGTIVVVPRHLPDWAPTSMPNLPPGDMNTDYHAFPPVIICGGLHPMKGRLNDCWKRHRAPVKSCVHVDVLQTEAFPWVVLIVVVVFICTAGGLLWHFYNK